MDGYRIGLVIPALNEGMTIYDVVLKASKYGLPIVVDDGSIDSTGEKAKEAGAEVVRHKINLGYESALGSGFQRADELGCDVVITLDADGQHEPSLIRLFIEKIKQGNDVVLGVRNTKPRLTEVLFAFYSKYKFGVDDPLCGMKAYKISVYRDFGCFDTYKLVGTELALFAAKNRHKYKVDQIKFNVKERVDNPRYGSLIKANLRIFRALIISIIKSHSGEKKGK